MRNARNVAAPIRGVIVAPASTISAPVGPPTQNHHDVDRSVSHDGAAGRRSSIATTAHTIVPQIEKNAAHAGLCKCERKAPFAAAWIAMQTPAPAASRAKTVCEFMGRRYAGPAPSSTTDTKAP